MTIRKKTWPPEFRAVKDRTKTIEFRVADFKIESGDTFVLCEWDPATKRFTGRELKRKVRAVYKFGLDDFGQKKLIEKKGFYVIKL